MNYYSHATQDSYTTFMRTKKGLDNTAASKTSITMKTGAGAGGMIIGYLSQWFGHHRAVIVSSFVSAALILAWILPTGESNLSVTGFFMQFFVQGALRRDSNPPKGTLATCLPLQFPWRSLSDWEYDCFSLGINRQCTCGDV